MTDKLDKIINNLISLQSTIKSNKFNPRELIAKKLDSIIKELKETTAELNKSKTTEPSIKERIDSISKCFKYKMTGGMCLYKSIQKSFKDNCAFAFIDKGGMIGKLIRQLFEFAFDPLQYLKQSTGYGNPLGHSVDIYLSENISGNTYTRIQDSITAELDRFMSNATVQLIYSKILSFNVSIPKIGDLTIRNVQKHKNNENIPQYVIETTDPDNNLIIFNVYGWIHESILDLSSNVSSICFNNNGIGIGNLEDNNYIMFNAMYSIISKQAIEDMDYSLQKLHDKACIAKYRDDKNYWFSKFNRKFKNHINLLTEGYNIVVGYNDNTTMPVYEIETVQHCHVTQCEPPYVNYILNCCGNKISMHAFEGMIKCGGSDDSEAITCPYCRESLKFKFVVKDPIKLSLWDPVDVVKNTHIDNTYKCNVQKIETSKQVFSQEVVEYLKELNNITIETKQIQRTEEEESEEDEEDEEDEEEEDEEEIDNRPTVDTSDREGIRN